MAQSSAFKLSICIATFNRAAFIGETLESIITQATSDCEIVVSDNASTDNTEGMVSEYARRFDRLRYIKQDTNKGMDRNFDCAVELARGEYCWLFSDDDVMKPGAVATILKALHSNYSLVLVNAELKDFATLNVRVPNFFGMESDRVYPPGHMDRLFTDVGTCIICMCCVVIQRSLWLSRDRQQHYGSLVIWAGVILQKPLPGETLVMAETFTSLRLDNEKTWAAARSPFLIIYWPSLIWSSCLSASTKNRFCSAEPWRKIRYMLAFRAIGVYSLVDYRRWVRPRLRSFWEMFIPVLVVVLPRKMTYRLCMNSPHDILSTMYPKSLQVLRERASGHN